MIAGSFTALSSQYDPGHLELPASFLSPPSRTRLATTDRAFWSTAARSHSRRKLHLRRDRFGSPRQLSKHCYLLRQWLRGCGGEGDSLGCWPRPSLPGPRHLNPPCDQPLAVPILVSRCPAHPSEAAAIGKPRRADRRSGLFRRIGEGRYPPNNSAVRRFSSIKGLASIGG